MAVYCTLLFSVRLYAGLLWCGCAACGDVTRRVSVGRQVEHLTYHLYLRCCEKVALRRKEAPDDDSTRILNDILADETWLTKVRLPALARTGSQLDSSRMFVNSCSCLLVCSSFVYYLVPEMRRNKFHK